MANIADLDASKLASLQSRAPIELSDGRDRISYLIATNEAGITTLLSAAYEEEIRTHSGR